VSLTLNEDVVRCVCDIIYDTITKTWSRIVFINSTGALVMHYLDG
jgi:hypothetical protein